MTTLEGLPAWYAAKKKLATVPDLHPVQQALIDEQALQCGYCFNGMIIKASELLSKTPQPTEQQIRARDERSSVPLRHLPAGHQGHSTCGNGDGGEGMSTRRDFIKSGGALIVGFSLGDALHSRPGRHRAPPAADGRRST